MKAAKSYRMFFSLPSDRKVLPSVLTGMIEGEVSAQISSKTGDINIEIDPVFIVDVPTKGRGFQLVIETCYEHQAKKNGPYLTSLVGENVVLTIAPPSGKPQPATSCSTPPVDPVVQGNISERTLKGLHVVFFRKNEFQDFLCECHAKAGGPGGDDLDFRNPDHVKHAFKSLVGVESCRSLDEETVAEWISNFNAWLRSGRQDG